MKYKRLGLEELKELEPEFINFLASNSIPAQEWLKIKTDQKEKMDELLDFFSDLVYEKVLKKITYLEHRTPKELRLLYFGEDQIRLLGLKTDQGNGIDFNSEDLIGQLKNSSNKHISTFSSIKKYQKERSQEIFELLESGCLITDDKLFNILDGIRNSI